MVARQELVFSTTGDKEVNERVLDGLRETKEKTSLKTVFTTALLLISFVRYFQNR